MLKREIGILLCLGIALIGVSGCSLKEVVSADLDKAKVLEAEAVSLFTEAVVIVKAAITETSTFTEAESIRLHDIVILIPAALSLPLQVSASLCLTIEVTHSSN